MMELPLAHSVNVVEVSKVAPAPPLPPQSSLPFTQYDALFLKLPPTQRLLFYQRLPNDNKTTTQILSELKTSLSITLRDFYPLAGKLVWLPDSDAPSTRYLHGDAISVTVADSSVEEFHRLVGGGYFPAVDYHPLLPKLAATREEVPVIALQVTFFGDEGVSVGYTAHHACIDEKSTSMFMHSWATICREKCDIETALKPEHTPHYDRTIINDPANQRKILLDTWLSQNGPNNEKSFLMKESLIPPNLIRGTFLLTRPNIENLKSSVQDKCKETYRLTSFRIMAAYVWTCLVKSQFTLIEGENSSDRFYLAFPADGRPYVGDPRALNYFGNCVGGGIVKLSLEQIWSEDAIVLAIKGISEAVEGLKESVILKKSKLGKDFNKPMKAGVVTTMSGYPWFKFYDVDFGWGKPEKVDIVSVEHSRSLSLNESRDGKGGIEVGIVLEEPVMDKFSGLFASGLQGH